MKKETVIAVEHVSKDFILPHQRSGSIKNAFTSLFAPKDKSKEVQHALKDINFEIQKGEFFGIVGRNGSGKSTLLKILAGIYQPTRGQVRTHGRLVPFIELGVGFNPELTGRENVYLNGAMLGFSEAQIDQMYDDIVEFAELERFMDQKLKNYSSGMQVRLAFSMATRSEADILLVDEVLAVGDAAFQRKCFDYFRLLKKNKKTVVFVSHDMNAVREYCDRAILIEKNEIIASGSADEIGTKYTKMFIDAPQSGKKAQSDKRWGDGAIRYTAASIKLIQHENQESIRIELEATAEKDVDQPNFGFLVRNSGGTAIFGTNSHLKHQFVDTLRAGNRVTVSWETANILNDGIYYLEPAIVYGGGATADWWEEADGFEIRKEEQTPYPVNPPIALHIKVSDKEKRDD